MNVKKFFKFSGLFLGFLVIIILIAFAFYFIESIQKSKMSSKKLKTGTVQIKDQVFNIEIAETKQQQEKGLSDKTDLKDNEGMLFEYSDKQIRNFWMNQMNFGLDIIFIDDDSVVDFATLNKPSGFLVPSYQSMKPANYVLEINAGLAKKLEIKDGDKVIIKKD